MPHFPSLNLSASESWIKGKLRKAPKINQDQPVCETCFESYFDVIIVLLLLFFFSCFLFARSFLAFVATSRLYSLYFWTFPDQTGWTPQSAIFLFFFIFFITVITFPFFLTIFVWISPQHYMYFSLSDSAGKWKTVSCGKLPTGRTRETV